MNALQTVQKFFPKVKHVKDAERDTIIEVLPADIKQSEKKKHAGCALAVAAKRQSNSDGVVVSISTAYLIKGNEAVRYHVPEAARREIVSFDRNGGFGEGEYALKRINESSKLGTTSGAHGRGRKSSGKPRFRHLTTGIREVLGAANRA